MHINRLSTLEFMLAGTCLVLTVTGCDSSGENTGAGGSASHTGGTTGTDSNAATGGNHATTGGSAANTGGVSATGGAASNSGGSTGCTTPVASKAANCGTPTVVSGSFTVSGNYFKIGTYQGYGYVYVSPTPNPAESVTCANSTFGSGTLTALCGAGVVPADCTNNAVGGVGFNLAQSKSGGDPAPAITATVQQVVVTFTNTANSDLHIQVVKYDGTTQTNYCFAAKDKPSPLTINANEFTTTCYLPDDPGTPWDGVGAESFQLIVPSRTPTEGDAPFDLCLQNVEFG